MCHEKIFSSKMCRRKKSLDNTDQKQEIYNFNFQSDFCMVQFVKPNLLGKYQEYMNRFVNPITNGQYTDSTEYDIQVMRRRAHVLHKLLDGCVQVHS